jgi:hypothetical protein
MSKYDVADRHAAIPLESLEARITPANFFMTPSGGIMDGSGNDVNIESLATEVGTGKAILMEKGDSLFYDHDGGLSRDKSDLLLFEVKGGASYVFLDDIITNDSIPWEISGVAATTKFSASANTKIYGDIATMTSVEGSGKNATYQFHKAIIADASIVGFQSRNGIEGSILAGGNISKIELLGWGSGFTVKDIRAGTAAGERMVDLGGDAPISVGAVVAEPGARGASISSLILRGAEAIVAGDGGAVTDPSSKLKAGAGGSVSNVTFVGSYFPNSNSGGSGGVIVIGGGSGGSIDVGGFGASAFQAAAAPIPNITVITAGSAGFGGDASGGSIGKISLKNIEFANIELHTGAGSDSGLEGRSGGNGGSFSGFKTWESTIKSLTITTGDGGNAGPGGDGGDGGKINSISLESYMPQITLSTGNGGSGVHGGQGGDFATSTLRSLRDFDSMTFTSGHGGDGSESGGDGGDIKKPFNFLPRVDINTATFTSGDGGNASSGQGGSAGALPRLDSVNAVSIVSRAGVDGTSTHDLVKPRNFFLTPEGNVVDASGKEVNLAALASEIGAAKAILLVKGDRLIFDANGDLSYNEGAERNLFQVEGGGSYVFLDDVVSGDSTPLDITGVAVSTGFAGSANADILGDIATMLTVRGKGANAVYQFNASITPEAAIAGFTSSGVVSGSILAGGSISRITISGEADGFSVRDIRAGTSSGDSDIDLGGTAAIHVDPVIAAPSARGASISFVTLAGGANVIAAGNGGALSDAASPLGTPGGSVNNITATLYSDITIKAGDAGNGAGGNVKNIALTGASEDASVTILAGNGALGVKSHGGSISNLSLLGTNLGDVTLTAGNAGDTTTNTIGIGGSLSDITAATASLKSLLLNAGDGGDNLNLTQTNNGNLLHGGDAGGFSEILVSGEVDLLTITGGNGGDGATTHGIFQRSSVSKGGNGTSIFSSGFTLAGTVNTFIATGGDGGSGAASGSGGWISGWTFQSSIEEIFLAGGDSTGGVSDIHFASGIFGTVSITSGNGAAGIIVIDPATGVPDSGSSGGTGGIIKNIVSDEGATINELNLKAGNGGDGMASEFVSYSGRGGEGGSITSVHLAGTVNSLKADAGDGGNGAAGGNYPGAYGEHGGSIRDISASHLQTLDISSGNGGSSWGRPAGSAGSVQEVHVTITDSASIIGGNGGNSIPSVYSDSAGYGGNVSDISITSAAGGGAGANVMIRAGDYGDGSSHYWAPETGGNLHDIAFESGSFNQITLRAGDGGDALSYTYQSTTGAGRAESGGGISRIEVSEGVAAASVDLIAGDGGNSVNLPGGKGGAGGIIDGTNFLLAGQITSLTMKAGNGGTGYELTGDGGTANLTGLIAANSIENLVISGGHAGDRSEFVPQQPPPVGGAGGDVLGGDFTVTGNASVSAGSGASVVGGTGGAGGDISGLTLRGDGAEAIASLSPGAGGTGNSLGAKGTVTNVSLLGSLAGSGAAFSALPDVDIISAILTRNEASAAAA